MKQSRLKPWVVYCLIATDGTPFYVGVTRNLARRLKEHRTVLGYKPLYRELEHGTSDRGEAEHRWIETMRADGFVLTNKTMGGNGGQSLSPESRQLVGAFHKGRPKSDAHRARIKAALIGNTPAWTPEGMERAQKSRFQPGHKRHLDYTAEQRQRMLSNNHPGSADHMREIGNTWRASLTDKELYDTGLRMSRLRDPDELRAHAIKMSPIGAKAAKQWWADMTPEYRADFLARRRAAKAAKRPKK